MSGRVQAGTGLTTQVLTATDQVLRCCLGSAVEHLIDDRVSRPVGVCVYLPVSDALHLAVYRAARATARDGREG